MSSTNAISSAWSQAQSADQRPTNRSKASFAAHLAQNGLSAASGASGASSASGGQLLSDDLSSALASYAPVSGAAVKGS